jgi:hypothetical protein
VQSDQQRGGVRAAREGDDDAFVRAQPRSSQAALDRGLQRA